MHRHKHKAWWCLLVDTHTQRKQQKQMLCVRIHQNEIHRWLRINIIQHAQIFPSSLFCVDVRVCWLSLSCFVLLFSAFSFGYCHHHHSSPINTKPIISVLAVTDVNFKMVFVIQYELYEWFSFGCCCFCRFSAHMYSMHTNTNTNIQISSFQLICLREIFGSAWAHTAFFRFDICLTPSFMNFKIFYFLSFVSLDCCCCSPSTLLRTSWFNLLIEWFRVNSSWY